MAEGRDQQEAEIERLQQQLQDAATLQEENRQMRDRLAAMDARHAEDIARLQQPIVNVKVAAPTLLPRLKCFTGLAPTGGNEVSFSEWEAQAEQVLNDTTNDNPLQTLKSTLRGLAREQIRYITHAEELVTRLRHIFGEVKPPDDLYLDFCKLQMEKKELPSAFLLRLWSQLLQINKTTQFTDPELRVKLYRTFVRALEQSYSMLSLEIRGAFGFPGTASPHLEDLLRTVRRLEETLPTSRATQSHSHAHQVTSKEQDALVDEIVSRVSERLETTLEAKLEARLEARLPRRGIRGGCFNCGEADHYIRDCPYPSNQAQWRESRRPFSKQQATRHQSSWQPQGEQQSSQRRSSWQPQQPRQPSHQLPPHPPRQQPPHQRRRQPPQQQTGNWSQPPVRSNQWSSQ